MTELEKAQKQVDLINHAIATLKECAAEERGIFHDKHPDHYYLQALDRLGVKQVEAEAYLYHIRILEQ